MTGPQGMGCLIPTITTLDGNSAYDLEILNGTLGSIWYSKPGPVSPYIWPLGSNVKTNNLASELNLGHIWFASWWEESGLKPTIYAEALPLGTIWLSNLADDSGDLGVVADGAFTTFDFGGYRYYKFTGKGDISIGAAGPATIDVMIQGGGGGGGRGGSLSTAGGGGGAGENRIILGMTSPNHALISIGAGGTDPNGTGVSGGDGQSSFFNAFEAIGGGGGGAGNVNGRPGACGGGGGAGTTPGSGGTGTKHYNGGNATGAAFSSRGGGGGVNGPGGTNSFGPGIEWPAGSGSMYGVGGLDAEPIPNTGNGGRGGYNASTSSGGSSGVVIVRHVL